MTSNQNIKVLILVGDWVEDYEAFVTIQALQMFSIQVDVVSPGKQKGQLVLSCVHDFERADIDGATDLVFANSLGIDKHGKTMQYQAVSERFGHAILITKDFDAVRIEDYRGVFCPGGRSPESLQLDKNVIHWIQWLNEHGRVVSSLCHGVQILAAAGVLRGKKCTGHPCCEPQAVSSGALWEPTNKIDTIVDGNLYTAAEWTGISGLLAAVAQALGVRWSLV